MNNINKVYIGILICLMTAFVSIELSNQIGEKIFKFEKSPVSPIIIAVTIGIFFSNVKFSYVQNYKSGYDFCIKYLLKLGIIFLGIRLSFLDLIELVYFGWFFGK